MLVSSGGTHSRCEGPLLSLALGAFRPGELLGSSPPCDVCPLGESRVGLGMWPFVIPWSVMAVSSGEYLVVLTLWGATVLVLGLFAPGRC